MSSSNPVLPLDNFAVLDPARAALTFFDQFDHNTYDKFVLIDDNRRRALMLDDLDDSDYDVTAFDKFDELDPALFATKVNVTFADD